MSHLNLGIFHQFLFYFKKLTCLVTLFDRKLQVFNNLPKWSIFGILKLTFVHRNVNVALASLAVLNVYYILQISFTYSYWIFDWFLRGWSRSPVLGPIYDPTLPRPISVEVGVLRSGQRPIWTEFTTNGDAIRQFVHRFGLPISL